MTDAPKKCGDCGNCVRVDQGCSSYTVEGTVLFCWLDLNPDMPFDDFYGRDKRSAFAETCPSYNVGDEPGFSIDVDGDDWDLLTPEQQEWCRSHGIDREPWKPERDR